MNGEDTRQAAALARHIKAALLHLRQAEDIAAAAGIDIDGGNDTARLIRAAGEATEDLDLWAINNARGHGADPAQTYQHTERWCHAPGGQLPERSWPAEASAEAAYRHYQEHRQPQDEAERELYERYAAVDQVNWWAGHDDAVAEIGQCSDYYRADEIRAEQPPDFTSWFSASRDAEGVADVEPDEKPGDPKGAHGAPVVSGPVLEHPTDPLNPRSDLVPSTGWDQELERGAG